MCLHHYILLVTLSQIFRDRFISAIIIRSQIKINGLC